jgi:hypothetical protein
MDQLEWDELVRALLSLLFLACRMRFGVAFPIAIRHLCVSIRLGVVPGVRILE